MELKIYTFLFPLCEIFRYFVFLLQCIPVMIENIYLWLRDN